MMADHRKESSTSAGALDQPLHPLTAAVLGLDPALIQFRLACRVLLSLLTVSLALAALHTVLPLSPAACALALVTAMQGLIAVRDASSAARAVTRVWSAVVGFALVGTISLLDHSLVKVNLLLLAVIFCAIYLKRFGARWQAVGVYAFFCCVLSGYLKPVEGELPGIAIGLLLSSAIAHLIRNYVLPEDPARDFRRLIASLHAMVLRFGHALDMAAPDSPAARRMRTRAERAADSAIQQAQSYLPLDDHQANDLVVDLLDLELSLRATALVAEDPAASRELLERRKAYVRDLDRRIGEIAAALPAGVFVASAPAKASGASSQAFLRLAVQVTLASAIAMVAGVALSPERWFWAVMTAFIVFTNTQSRGETLVRGLARTGGTALGVVVGIVLATLVAGALVPTIVLATVALFIGFLIMVKSYSAFTLCLTIAISLIYGLLGEFTPQLMELRLEETLIGAAAGVLVSFSVLPTRTAARLSAMFGVYLQTIDGYLARWDPRCAQDSGPAPELRAVKAAEMDVMSALAPMRSAWNLGARQKGPQAAAIYVSATQQWIEAVARELQRTPPSAIEGRLVQDVRDAIGDARRGGFNLFAQRDDTRVATWLRSAPPFSTEVALRRLLVVLDQISIRGLDAPQAV